MTAIVVARQGPLRRRLALTLAAAFAAGGLLWAALHYGISLSPLPVRIPVIIVIPWWVWAIGFTLAAIYIGLVVYRNQAILDQLDKATDDADNALGLTRKLAEQLEEARGQLAALSARPTPYRRDADGPAYGRHAARPPEPAQP